MGELVVQIEEKLQVHCIYERASCMHVHLYLQEFFMSEKNFDLITRSLKALSMLYILTVIGKLEDNTLFVEKF